MQPDTQDFRLTINDVDKRLRKSMFVSALLLTFFVLIVPMALIPTEVALARHFPAAFGWSATGANATTTALAQYPLTKGDTTRVFQSLPVRAIGGLSALLVLLVFALGISRTNKQLLEYARKFVEYDEWNNVVSVLLSFNQSGQQFLDRTGEAHYLLSMGFKKMGKPELSKQAKDFVLKRRSKSEWAQKLQENSQAITAHGPNPARRKMRKRR